MLIVAFLARGIPADGAVLDVACDRGYFIRNVHARERWATNIRAVGGAFDASVRFVQVDGLALSTAVPGAHFDVVFMSNYLEHLADGDAVLRQLREAWAVLKPGGRLIVLQPNIRLVGGAYWDFLDHKVALTERSLGGGGRDRGLRGETTYHALPPVHDEEPAAAESCARARVPPVPAGVAAHGQAIAAGRPATPPAGMTGDRRTFLRAAGEIRVFLRALAGIAVSAFAILLVAQTADIPAAIARIAAVDARWLVLPALVLIVQMWVRAVRWAIILSAVQPVPITGRMALWPTIAGYLGNIALPARLGEVIRIVLISRRWTPVTATGATASVLIERRWTSSRSSPWRPRRTGRSGPSAGCRSSLGDDRPARGLRCRAPGHRLAGGTRAHPGSRRASATSWCACSRRFGATGPSAVLRAWVVSLLAWLFDALVIYFGARAPSGSRSRRLPRS